LGQNGIEQPFSCFAGAIGYDYDFLGTLVGLACDSTAALYARFRF
jgi:hypothetical protein